MVAFLALFVAWSLLPSRLLGRRRSGEATPSNPPPSVQPVPAPVPRPALRGSGVVELRLVRNPHFHHAAGEKIPRYFYPVWLNGSEAEARLPVYWNPRPRSADPLVREQYRVCVAGRTLEAGNLHLLGELVRTAALQLVPSGRPPQLWLVCGPRWAPVYRTGADYEAITDGPRLRAPDLLQLRTHYAHYIACCNGVAHPEVRVALLQPEDLGVREPEAVLVSPNLWIPAFDRAGQWQALGPAGITWSAPAGAGAVVSLWRVVAQAVVGRGLLRHPADLRLSELSQRCSSDLQGCSEPTGLTLGYVRFAPAPGRVVQPVRRIRDVYVANCSVDGCVHLAFDPAVLRAAVACHLVASGAIPDADAVVLRESAGVASPSRDGLGLPGVNA